MTKRIQESDQRAAGQSPNERPQRTRRKPVQPKLHISFLPEGRGGVREDKGSVPLEVDVEAHIEERTDCEAGLYRIEKKRSGEFSGEVLWYTKEDYREPANSADESDDEENRREFNSSEPPVTNGLDSASIAKLVAATVNATMEARDRRERAATGQQTALDQAERMYDLAERSRKEAREELRLILAQQHSQPTQAQPLDEETVLTKAVLSKGLLKRVVENAVDAIGSSESAGEPATLTDRLFGFASQFVPYVAPLVAPVVGQRLVSILNQVDDASLMGLASQAVQPQQQPQPQQVPVPPSPYMQQPQQVPVEPTQQQSDDDDEPVTLDSVINFLIADLQDGDEPEGVINDIVRLTTSQPAYLPMIAEMVSQPNARLVQMLGEARRIDLSQLVNADAYLEALRAGLKKRIRLPEPRPVAVAANNGNGAQAVVKAGSGK